LKELALHLLDIAENSVAANAESITISVLFDTEQDLLQMSIEDDGKGMAADQLAKITDPFVTSRTTRKVGLGIPLFKAAAESCNGSFDIQSTLGQGTTVTATFQESHIDRMPLGDLQSTLISLLIGYPDVHWVLKYGTDGNIFIFDDAPIKKELEGIALTDPGVLGFLNEYIASGIENTLETQTESSQDAN
jgi:anti-sigma regulatory factor (Ser/Thr protein kinase)